MTGPRPREGGRALDWTLDENGVAVLTLDVPGQPVNTLRRELAGELEDVLGALAAEPALRAVVLRSGKPASFIAGADLNALGALRTAAEISELARLLQRMTGRIESLEVPTVAAIHGDCLGGGLELALAFDARIASEDPATRLGLPEVQLGLLPGGGGTQRLVPLIGLPAAMDLLLTGRRVSARRARDLGLVDRVVPEQSLSAEAATLARAMASGGRAWFRRNHPRPARRWLSRTGLVHRALAGNPLGRSLVFARLARDVARRTRGHYPAPPRILEVVRRGLEQGPEAGLRAEAEAFGELALTPESRALVGLFFASTELRKDFGPGATEADAVEVGEVGVLGAGLMGAGIALVSAWRARAAVRLRDRDAATAQAGREQVRAALERRVERGRMEAAERDAVLDRIRSGGDELSLDGCAVVVEAVFEDLGVKHEVLAAFDRDARADAIFASNTSAIPIAEIAADSADPARVIGMHYFSPVERMPLLEVVVTPRTAPRVTATCVRLGQRQGKTVVVVRDGPGFFTTRVLAPYMNEAAWLLSEGVAVDTIDAAVVDFGFPMGPLALLDSVGIDVGAKVAQSLQAAFGARMAPPAAMEGLVADGRQGAKNARGFYRYERPGGRPGGVDPGVYAAVGVSPGTEVAGDELAGRCVAVLLNEAVRCLDEGILRSPRDGDVAAVFGLGFPPFLGGPFRYLDRVGPATLCTRLDALGDARGERFQPCERLRSMADSGERFHPED